MAVRIDNVVIDCANDAVMLQFWAGLLGYEVEVNQPGDWVLLRDPAGTLPRIGLQVVPEPKVVKNRVHLDLYPTAGGLDEEARRIEGLGGRRVRYVENGEDESHWIMADREGNEFCLIRPEWEPRPPAPPGR